MSRKHVHVYRRRPWTLWDAPHPIAVCECGHWERLENLVPQPPVKK
jgi:hypothetical protein